MSYRTSDTPNHNRKMTKWIGMCGDQKYSSRACLLSPVRWRAFPNNKYQDRNTSFIFWGKPWLLNRAKSKETALVGLSSTSSCPFRFTAIECNYFKDVVHFHEGKVKCGVA
jgi:hypothetical protein